MLNTIIKQVQLIGHYIIFTVIIFKETVNLCTGYSIRCIRVNIGIDTRF